MDYHLQNSFFSNFDQLCNGGELLYKSHIDETSINRTLQSNLWEVALMKFRLTVYNLDYRYLILLNIKNSATVKL